MAWRPLQPTRMGSSRVTLLMASRRPLKVKPTRRLPPSLRVKKQPDSPIMPISQFLSLQQHPADQHRKSSLVPLSCQDLLKRQKRLRLEESKETQEESEEETDGVAGENDPGAGDDDEGDGFEVNCEVFHLPDPHLGGDLGAIAVENVEAENDSLSYEELVARKVEDFITKSKEAMTSSELSQRVSRWHDMIEPRLESLERRKPFDIHDYGTRILRQVQAAGRSEVAFREVVGGQQKEEISR